MKKLGMFLLGIFGILSLNLSTVKAEDIGGFGDTTYVKGVGVAGAKDNAANDDSLIAVVKNLVNWVLGILGLIALVILLYGAFGMVTAAGDDAKYKNGFKILKQAAVGLFVTGVSWFVIGLIFDVITKVTGTK